MRRFDRSIIALLSLIGLVLLLFMSRSVAFAAESTEIQSVMGPGQTAADRLWVLMAAALVLLMQAGFLCFEVGVVQRKNSVATAMKNLIDFAVVSLAFFLVGFGLMFGPSASGLFGTDLFFLNDLDPVNGSPLGVIFFVFQMVFAGTALTIVSGAMTERTAFIPYMVGSLLMGSLIYPIFGHWAWGDLLLRDNDPWLARLGFMDFAGSTVVHSVGAWVALVGAWMVGQRIGRYDDQGNVRPLKENNPTLTGLGVLILWVGWWGFNGGSTLALDDRVGGIILNTNLAGAAAGFSAFFHCFLIQNREGLYAKLMGGLLSGLVAITAGCNVVTPFSAVAIGLVAGVIHNWAYDFIQLKLKVDDPVSAIAVHGFSGAWGTLCVGLFGQSELLIHSRLHQIGIQILGILTCLVWTTSTAYLMFRLLKMTVGLRVSPELERDGIDIAREFETPPSEVDPDLIEMLESEKSK